MMKVTVLIVKEEGGELLAAGDLTGDDTLEFPPGEKLRLRDFAWWDLRVRPIRLFDEIDEIVATLAPHAADGSPAVGQYVFVGGRRRYSLDVSVSRRQSCHPTEILGPHTLP